MLTSVTDKPILFPSPPLPNLCHQWTFQSLCNVLKDKKLLCRVWRKSKDQVLETECHHVQIMMNEFWEWLMCSSDTGNPLHPFERATHAAYIDYKYMKDVFCECPLMLDEVQWKGFGLPDFDGNDSTIWIGSEGSNTSGHQDTYGFNLVTQIEGRKLWVLFPPSDTVYLHPSRVPYEESSIFSQVHMGCPDVEKHPEIMNSHPLVVILHPGQTLYVPHHWWHYVESLDPSISINVWIPHNLDNRSHLTECITRCLATTLVNDLCSHPTDSQRLNLVNPTETLFSTSENLKVLQGIITSFIDESCYTQNSTSPISVMDDISKHGENQTAMFVAEDCSSISTGMECERGDKDVIDHFYSKNNRDGSTDYKESCCKRDNTMYSTFPTITHEGKDIISEDIGCEHAAEMAGSSSGKKFTESGYLAKFGEWLESCHIVQAPAKPCLGVCVTCETRSEGCLATQSYYRLKQTEAKNDQIKNVQTSAFATEDFSYHTRVEKEISRCVQPLRRSGSCSSGHSKMEQDNNDNRDVVHKRTLECEHKFRDVKRLKNEQCKILQENKQGDKVHNIVSIKNENVYSLATPFPPDLYLKLMRLKNKNLMLLKPYHFEINDDEEAKTLELNEATIDRADEKMPRHHCCSCLGFRSYLCSGLKPAAHTELVSGEQCELRNKTSNKGLSENNVNRSSALQSALSETKLKNLLLDSVLHPSVIQTIAEIFESKCKTLITGNTTQGAEDLGS